MEQIFYSGPGFRAVTLREASLFTGWGGAAADANPYNSRESPYLRKRFFTCPLILPKDSENILGQKLFNPLRRKGPGGAKNFKHVLNGGRKFFNTSQREGAKNFQSSIFWNPWVK